MLGNTMALTIGGVAKTLNYIGQSANDPYSGEYVLAESTQEFRAKVRHTRAKSNNGLQNRHNVELTRTVFATSTTPEYIDKMYYVLQADPGRSAIDLAAGLFAWSTATSNAMMAKLEGWES